MLRKLFILPAFFILLIPVAKAQLATGNILVGADVADINLNLNRGGNFSFSLNPKIGWFIKPAIAVGPYATFALSTAKEAGTSINYGIGAFGRYYFSRDEVNILRHMRLFAEANAGFEGYNPAVGDNTNGIGLGFGPGVAYFITPSVSLELLAKYDAIVGFGSAPASNNLNIQLGFQVYLPSNRVIDRVQDTRK